jgi:hypothetical protein
MDLQTKVDILPSDLSIDYSHQILSLGSCFADNIGRKLRESCFDVDVNPFGVLFNPLSIAHNIHLILDGYTFGEKDLVENKGLWHSFEHSGLFSDITMQGCLQKINSRYNHAIERMHNNHFLLITFGTAWVFESKKSGKIVSNCHKLPSSDFIRRKLTVSEIVDTYLSLIEKIRNQNSNVKILFSVSPIRHLSDGAHENNISKSTLHLAVDELVRAIQGVNYFPAFEIMMDELRDYRFYATDMCHPSAQTVDYLYEKFCNSYCTPDTLNIKLRIDQLLKDIHHKPIHPQTEEYQRFVHAVSIRKALLIKEYPFLATRFE